MGNVIQNHQDIQIGLVTGLPSGMRPVEIDAFQPWSVDRRQSSSQFSHQRLDKRVHVMCAPHLLDGQADPFSPRSNIPTIADQTEFGEATNIRSSSECLS